MVEDEKFASVLVSDLLRSNEETLRLRARIAELEECLRGLCLGLDAVQCDTAITADWDMLNDLCGKADKLLEKGK